MRCISLCLLIIALSNSISFAQESASVVDQAKKLISEKNCNDAVPLLKNVYNKKFRFSEGEKASVLLTECYLRQQNRAEAEKVTSKYLEYYIKTPYRERMEVASAILLIEKGSVYDGVEGLLRILAYTKNPAAYSHAKDIAIHTLAASLLTSDQLFALVEKYPVDKDILGWLYLQLGRESQNERRYKAARYWYRKVQSEKVSEKLIETAEQGLESLEDVGAGIPTILVLAPVSGDFAEYGVAAIQGVLLAYETANLAGKVNIRIADTRADAAIALWRTQQAVNQDSIIAIIGPIMSAPSATVAAWLGSNFQHIPMLTPTATDDGIARMGPNIFQLNITIDRMADAIADFAIRCLDIREFAILSPIGDYGNAMSNSFTRAVERRGAVILAQQYYEEGRPDYKTEFDLLRNLRFKQENRRRNIAKGVSNLDAIPTKERRAYLQDSVFQFPGIFIPSTNPSDAGLMAGQVAFNKINGVLLGTSGWYGRDLLIQGKRQVEGAYFTVPFLDLEKSEAYKKFENDFSKKWGVEPGRDKVSGLSYDAMNIIIEGLSQKPNNLANQINWTQKFNGIYGEIKFKNGANTNAQVVTVNKSQFVSQTQCVENAK
ncbi:MAG TPA: penicillin-binding protein activator [Fibrobacteraceae bacterium]|jgi:ABC-type branched-subunit amino acid transport system substrate-binding protein|nr:amino acid ABC transporter substrate-binding protein [Fibrobacter sp.]HOG67779.1 penicillin-binding protein activator [Fibrobacteraceae bacterium]